MSGTERLLPNPSTSDNSVRVNCTRCGKPATNHYEGVEYIDLCDDCLSDFEDWLCSADTGGER